jgi:hypothetical protein
MAKIDYIYYIIKELKMIKPTIQDADFFQSLIGKKIECKKDYKWRKNSLTCFFAYMGDKMTVQAIDIDINPKDQYYIQKCEYKNLAKEIAKGATIEDFTINVKKLNGKLKRTPYLPGIRSKNQFSRYFTIL